MSRILQLPQRDWRENQHEIAALMTERLRTPWGTQTLFPVQAVSLLEGAEVGGLYAAIRVGGGKTLIAALLPTVIGAQRPLIITPGGKVQREKNSRAMRELRHHWQIYAEPSLPFRSYSNLSQKKDRPQQDQWGNLDVSNALLWRLRPDAIVFDEAHLLKAFTKAACAIHVALYKSAFPATKLFTLSGTFDKDGVDDYAHILLWALGAGAPIPQDLDLCHQLTLILNDEAEEATEHLLECMAQHYGPCRTVEELQDAFRDRLIRTPGVIITQDSFSDVPLEIECTSLEVPREIELALEDVRTAALAPDGWPLAQHAVEDSHGEVKGGASEAWDLARTLAQGGFYYRHDPWPPEDWFKTRSQWNSFCAQAINASHMMTELDVREACARGWLDSCGLYEKWRAIEPTFTIHRVPAWISDFMLDYCHDWGLASPGIIWVHHKAFGRRLQAKTGWRYFDDGGTCKTDGSTILDCDKGEVAIASMTSCSTGLDLQYKWHRNLIACVNPSSLQMEQLVGRTHRFGARRKVKVEIIVNCREAYEAVQRCYASAMNTYRQQSQPQKILTADLAWPSVGTGPAWAFNGK